MSKNRRANEFPLAYGRIRLGIEHLADHYPFHAKILEQFNLQSHPGLVTLAVTIVRDDLRLLFNPQFVLEITEDELRGVLLHETHHVVFEHLLIDPAKYPDRWARIVAEEVTANEFIVEPLPGQPILLEQFPILSPMESTHHRYQLLENLQDRQAIALTSMQNGGNQSGVEEEAVAESTLACLDDHSLWSEALQDPSRSDAVIRAAIQDAVIQVGLAQVPDELHETLSDLRIGQVRGGLEYPLAGIVQGQLDWQRLLREFIGRHRKVRANYCYPPRRFPKFVGIFPGRRRRGTSPHILAVIDTSASMTSALLDEINGELASLARAYDVTVAECDAEVQRVYSYQSIKSVCGRGGTDLRPVFESTFLQTYSPDLVLYFTDGFGPAPEDPPTLPVLWCLTAQGEKPASWGEVVKMSELPHHPT